MIILVMLMTLLCSCTDATWDKYAVLGNEAEVMCYSGGERIFHGISTGKVSNETNSDGYFARWKVLYLKGKWKHVPKDIGNLERLSAGIGGDCIIIYTE